MKAAVVHTRGQPPRYQEFPDPAPGPDQVIVRIAAAGLHPVVRSLADGSHYGSAGDPPLVPGVDGVGRLDDGTRVMFGGLRPPYGTMAELAAVPRRACFPLPDSLDDVAAAALFNPGLASWTALLLRAQLVAGETVLVLGATGVSGQLAVQSARRLGAGRVIAAGRNPDVLRRLPELGADEVIALDQPHADLVQAIARAAGDGGIHVILDYLWGQPTEAAIAAVTRRGLDHAAPRVRLVEIGACAGPTIQVPAAVLRSSGLEILGSGAGSVPLKRILEEVAPRFLACASRGELRVDVEPMPIADVEQAWTRPARGRRIVLTT